MEIPVITKDSKITKFYIFMEVLVKCITKTISITELQKSFQVLYEVKISNAIIFPHFFFSYAPPVLHMAKIQYNASRQITYRNL